MYLKNNNSMKNWKTSLIGALLAIIVAIQPLITTGEINWNQVGFAALIALFGFVQKDHDVTGGTKAQDTISNPPIK